MRSKRWSFKRKRPCDAGIIFFAIGASIFCATSEMFASGRQAGSHARYLRTMAARKSIQAFPVKVSCADWLGR